MKKKILNRSDVQFIIFIIAVLATLNHSLVDIGEGISWISSGYLHYVCPICGVTTIYQLFASNLAWIEKLANPVTWVILATMLMALLYGPLFCGWICPFGAFQDFLANIIGKKIFKKKYNKFVNTKVDSKLRWLRYVSLVLVFYMVSKSAVTVLESINPYHALLNLFVGEFSIIGLVFLLIIIVASLFIHRPWCKYLCPYGALLGIFNVFRIKPIVRNKSTCIGCKKCDISCPMNIKVSKTEVVRDHQCISCLECTSSNACPINDTVNMKRPKGIVERIQVNTKTIIIFIVAMITFGLLTYSATSSSTTASTHSVDVSYINNQLDGNYESGTYTGEGMGFNPGLKIELTIDNNQITDIEITNHNETIGYYEYAFVTVPNSILTSQSTNVDTISGATYSSEGIIEGVNDALDKALITSQTTTIMASTDTINTSNESVSTQQVSNNQINGKVKLAQESNNQTVIEEVEQVVEVEELEQVDQIQQIEQVEELEEIEILTNITGIYKDGIYTGTGIGYGGKLTVEVIVNDGNIQSVEIIQDNETPKFLSRTTSLVDEIVDSQSTDVDTISRATISSNAIIDAVNNALENAK